MAIEISFSDGKLEIKDVPNSSPKREKGNSLLEFPTDYTIIDLETTGYDPRYDEIIQKLCSYKCRNKCCHSVTTK